MPVALFIISIPVVALWGAGWSPFSGTLAWYKALQNADLIIWSLLVASIISLSVSVIVSFAQKQLSAKQLLKISVDGFELMKGALIVLFLAWTLSGILKDDLQTGAYLASFVTDALPVFLLPVIFFLLSTIISASTGSSWGTISVMLPIGIPMIAALNSGAATIVGLPLLLPLIAAILAGAVAGSHISPITDATIMASTSARSYHLDHVQTQTIYSIPAIIAATLCFGICPLLPTSALSSITLIIGGCILTGIILQSNNKS